MKELDDLYKEGYISYQSLIKLEKEFEAMLDREILDEKNKLKQKFIDMELLNRGFIDSL